MHKKITETGAGSNHSHIHKRIHSNSFQQNNSNDKDNNLSTNESSLPTLTIITSPPPLVSATSKNDNVSDEIVDEGTKPQHLLNSLASIEDLSGSIYSAAEDTLPAISTSISAPDLTSIAHLYTSSNNLNKLMEIYNKTGFTTDSAVVYRDKEEEEDFRSSIYGKQDSNENIYNYSKHGEIMALRYSSASATQSGLQSNSPFFPHQNFPSSTKDAPAQSPDNNGKEVSKCNGASLKDNIALVQNEKVAEEAFEEHAVEKLSRIHLILLCVPAAAVQIGWYVGEALLLPYLLSLGVKVSTANFVFLINPIFGLFLQPICGYVSDHCRVSLGKRTPFLLLFHCGSIFGLSIVAWSESIAQLLTSGAALDDQGRASTVLVVIIFLGFGIMDMSHDLLLMPARALLNDCVPDEQVDDGNAYFAIMSSIGACLGLGLILIPFERISFLHFLQLPIRATFTVATLLILTSNIITFIVSRKVDKPAVSHSDVAQTAPELESERMSHVETPHDGLNPPQYSRSQSGCMEPQHREESSSLIPPTSLDHRSVSYPEQEKEAIPNPDMSTWQLIKMLPAPLIYIWFVQLMW